MANEDKEKSNWNGALAEVLFIGEAMKNGFVVSRPIFDKCIYDFVIEKKGILNKIQVKSAWVLDKKAKSFKVSLRGGKIKRNIYNSGNVDIIAVYLGEKDLWYLIPVKKIGNLSKLSLNGKVDEFINNWRFNKN